MYIDIFNKKPIKGSVKDIKPIEIIMVSDTEEELLWDDLVYHYHYLGHNKMTGRRRKYLIIHKQRPLAALGFHSASIKLKSRDEYIGWSADQRKQNLNLVVNNNRFVIFPWVQVKNLASHVLSQTLKQLPRDWDDKYNIEPVLVETFVDLSRYDGTCYQAANWTFLGKTKGYTKKGKSYQYHGNKKGVYVYPLKNNFRKIIGCKKSFPSRTHHNKSLGRKDQMLNHENCEWDPDLLSEIQLTENEVEQLGTILLEYHNYFQPCFNHSSQEKHSKIYLKGLLSDLERKSIEPIALNLLDEKEVRLLQHYFQKGKWDEDCMLKLYQSRAGANISDENGMLTIDGSGFVKKGKESAAVARQYCGRLGKKESCQVGVFLGYTSKKGYGLLDSQLYVPEIWFSDEYKQRYQKCGIPQDLDFMTKPEIAFLLLERAQEFGYFDAKWVGCDSIFGMNHDFIDSISDDYYYFADVRSNTLVWLQRPKVELPPYKGIGRRPSKKRPLTDPISVSDIAEDPSLEWEKVILNDGAKGPIVAEIACLRVIECRDNLPGKEVWLYIRKLKSGKTKYAISNAPEDIPKEELNQAAIMRWPIEQTFETGKSELGMDQYELRSWRGWHCHMLYVFIAMFFLFEVQQRFKKK